MEAINATEVRKEWSAAIDSVVREKPMFIKRTRDYVVMSDAGTIELLLEAYEYIADKYIEDDGSVTLSLREMDLVENAPDEKSAIKKLAESIFDYAKDFYKEYSLWSKAPNRKHHIPYVLRAIMLNDAKELEAMILCQDGRS